LMVKEFGPTKRSLRSIQAHRMMSSVTWPKLEFQNRNAQSKPRARHSKNGAALHLKRDADCSSELPTSCNAGATNFRRWKFSKSARLGRKRTATFARQWTSAV